MRSDPHVAALDYLAEVVKDWAVSSFAAAESAEFTLRPHRFELDGFAVLRRPLSRRCREARSPLDYIGFTTTPTAWARSETLTVLVGSEPASDTYEQEIVEVLCVEADEIVAAAACVVRSPGLPPCLGPFWAVP
jgi:hypothetical protein